MSETPHFLRFARALTLGAAAAAAAVGCTNSESNANTSTTSTTTAASAGNEQPAAAEPDASAPVVAAADAPTPPSNGAPCASVGEHRVGDNPSSPARLSCTCHAADGGPAQWSCAEMPMRIMGPAAPPELAA